MEFGRNICKIPPQIKNQQYKKPKLQVLYEKVCKDKNFKFHSAKNDVYAVLLILSKSINL